MPSPRTVLRALAPMILLAACAHHHDDPTPVAATGPRPQLAVNPVALPDIGAYAAGLTTTTTTTVPPAPKTTQGTATAAAATPPPDGSTVLAVIAAHFDGGLYRQAVNVADCESSLAPDARNGPNYGLFQISSVHADQWAEVIGRPMTSSWSDPDANATFARWLYDQSGGWGPWECRWAASR